MQLQRLTKIKQTGERVKTEGEQARDKSKYLTRLGCRSRA